MANLDGQHLRICNHHGHESLGMSVKDFPPQVD